MEEEEEEAAGSGRGLCTLNTQTDVLLLTQASFNHGAFIFLPLTLKPGLPHPLTRCCGSPSLCSQGGGGGGGIKATQTLTIVPRRRGEHGHPSAQLLPGRGAWQQRMEWDDHGERVQLQGRRGG